MDMVAAEEVQEAPEETELERVPVLFTPDELWALAEFFNSEDGTLEDVLYQPIARKLLIYAAKYGLYDEEL